MEYNPDLKINDGGEEIPFNRDTACLFKFLGEWATHDHIFVIINEEDNEYASGYYIFKSNNGYQTLARYMIDSKFIIHLNMPEPEEMDKQAFDAAHFRDLTDFPPNFDEMESPDAT